MDQQQPPKRRGRPLAESEPRTARQEYRTTPTRKAKLRDLAAAEGIDVSELLDRLVDQLQPRA